MSENASPVGERVCAAEVIAALSLATDLATGLPLEHGLESTLAAMRLAERLGVDAGTERQTYYACLLFYVGCTADAQVAADLFDESALFTHFAPAMFGSQRQIALATLRALVPLEGPAPARAAGVACKLPRGRGLPPPRRGGLRGRRDADRPARPAARRPGAVRRLHRALGRQGRARPGARRGDPAGRAHRARRA